MEMAGILFILVLILCAIGLVLWFIRCLKKRRVGLFLIVVGGCLCAVFAWLRNMFLRAVGSVVYFREGPNMDGVFESAARTMGFCTLAAGAVLLAGIVLFIWEHVRKEKK